jgi:hypothetical protein
MADEDDDFETDMDDDAGTEGDDDAGTEGEGEADTDDPAELKKRLAKQAAALKKANAQAARLRAAAKKAPAKKAVKAVKPAESAQEGTEAGRAAEDADARFTRHAIRTEGAAAILEAGFSGDRKAARDLTRLLDAELLDVDEDGEVDGLDEAVEELVEKYPGLFAKQEGGAGRQQAPRRRVQSIDSAAGSRSGRRGSGNGQPVKSSAERIGALLRKGA